MDLKRRYHKMNRGHCVSAKMQCATRLLDFTIIHFLRFVKSHALRSVGKEKHDEVTSHSWCAVPSMAALAYTMHFVVLLRF
jgi:hypothetical protein